jgi:hypothetical protein
MAKPSRMHLNNSLTHKILYESALQSTKRKTNIVHIIEKKRQKKGIHIIFQRAYSIVS